MLAVPLHNVEAESPFETPAAARKISIKGPTVSVLWAQNKSLDVLPLSKAEYSNTAISCSPPSEDFVRFDRYENNRGSADDSLFDKTGTLEIKLVRTVDVSNGIGPSGSFD
jgi:hypothetical protein